MLTCKFQLNGEDHKLKAGDRVRVTFKEWMTFTFHTTEGAIFDVISDDKPYGRVALPSAHDVIIRPFLSLLTGFAVSIVHENEDGVTYEFHER
jgi:hypothetical protein